LLLLRHLFILITYKLISHYCTVVLDKLLTSLLLVVEPLVWGWCQKIVNAALEPKKIWPQGLRHWP